MLVELSVGVTADDWAAVRHEFVAVCIAKQDLLRQEAQAQEHVKQEHLEQTRRGAKREREHHEIVQHEHGPAVQCEPKPEASTKQNDARTKQQRIAAFKDMPMEMFVTLLVSAQDARDKAVAALAHCRKRIKVVRERLRRVLLKWQRVSKLRRKTNEKSVQFKNFTKVSVDNM